MLLPVLLIAVIDSKATDDLCSQDQALLFRESGDVGVAQCTMQVRQPRHEV